MADQQQLQQAASQVKRMEQQIQQVNQKKQQVESTIEMIEETREGLQDLSGEEKEGFSDVGAGVYMQSTMKGNEKVLVNVGADIAVEKEPTEAVNYLGDKKDELLEAKDQYQSYLKQLQQKYQQLIKQMREMQQSQDVQ